VGVHDVVNSVDKGEKMKLVLGYIATFLLVAFVVASIFYGTFILTILSTSFVTWTLPSVGVDWLVALRAGVLIGTLVGVWFICRKEGQDFAKDIVNDFLSKNN